MDNIGTETASKNKSGKGKGKTAREIGNGAAPKGPDFGPPSPVRAEGRLQYWRPEDLTIVGLDTEADGSDPLWDERNAMPLNPRKVENVFLFGVQGTIKIEMRDGRPCIKNGRTSTRWAREANKWRIADDLPTEVMECVVEDAADPSDREAVRASATTVAVTNVHENDDPITEARKMARYMGEPFNFTKEELATRFGCNAETVANRLRLLKLTPPVQALVAGGELGPTAAAKLATLEPAEQVDGADALREVGKINDVDTAARVLAAIKAAKKSGKGKEETKEEAKKAAKKSKDKPKATFVDRVIMAAGGKCPKAVNVVLDWIDGSAKPEEIAEVGWLAEAIAKVRELDKAKAAKKAAKADKPKKAAKADKPKKAAKADKPKKAAKAS